jgi:hypothetical protein
LSRWSRRKNTSSSQYEHEVEPPDLELDKAPLSDPSLETAELVVNEDMLDHDDTDLPVWQQESASSDEKKAALRALFKQPEFNQVDRLNDYDQDFAQYTSLKGVVTAQMKRMIKLAEQTTRPDEELNSANTSVENLDDYDESELTSRPEKEEDKPLA